MNHPGTLNLFGEKTNLTVHKRESNSESQSSLEIGRKKFGGDLWILFNHMMTGAITNNRNSPVPEFRRRRQDLTDDNGVHITFHSKVGALKNWHMTPENIIFNQKFK